MAEVFTVRLTDEQAALVREIAKQSDRSRGSVMRILLDHALHSEGAITMTDVPEIARQVAAENADPTGSRPMRAEVPAGVDLVNDQPARDSLRQQIRRIPEVGR